MPISLGLFYAEVRELYSYQIQIIFKQIYLTHKWDKQVVPL